MCDGALPFHGSSLTMEMNSWRSTSDRAGGNRLYHGYHQTESRSVKMYGLVSTKVKNNWNFDPWGDSSSGLLGSLLSERNLTPLVRRRKGAWDEPPKVF